MAKARVKKSSGTSKARRNEIADIHCEIEDVSLKVTTLFYLFESVHEATTDNAPCALADAGRDLCLAVQDRLGAVIKRVDALERDAAGALA